jgi:hypothetical protein
LIQENNVDRFEKNKGTTGIKTRTDLTAIIRTIKISKTTRSKDRIISPKDKIDRSEKLKEREFNATNQPRPQKNQQPKPQLEKVAASNADTEKAKPK